MKHIMKGKIIIRLIFVLFFGILLFPVDADGKNGKNVSDSLCVVNEILISILDNIVIHESHCEYYTPQLIFNIKLQHNNYILIGTIGNRILKASDNLGCFEYKNHLFVVDGNSLDTRLFSKTEKKKHAIFSKSKTGYDKKSKRWTFDIDAIQDDSYSYWYYKYVNNEFIYQWSSTFCDKNDSTQKRELITKDIKFDLKEIELKDSMFIKKLNDLTIDIGDTLIAPNKKKKYSLFISKKDKEKYRITISEILKLEPRADDIGFYIEDGIFFKIEGEIIEDVFCVTNNKKQFRAKIIIGTKYKGRILPYLESYIDHEWWFIYKNGEIILLNESIL
ncbi:hypothetical protein AGMMS49965_26290 [Bacteroidia bacterium]|nr:hypothetical protein AGMMS49965_26290 [Bacteroidia bacterium]